MSRDAEVSAADLAAALKREHAAREEAERHRIRAQRLVAEAVAAEERERGRLAQALHDGPVQNLLAAQIELRRASAHAGFDLDRPLAVIAESINELRAAIFALHPLTLEHFGLGHAVRQLANEIERHHQVEVAVQVPPQVPKAHEALLFSLARELLSNAGRHAQATLIVVRVVVESEAVELEVTDNGVGLTDARRRAALREGHIGLISSEERVQALGGQFGVSTSGRKGAKVRIRLPSRRESDLETARPLRRRSGAERRGLAV